MKASGKLLAVALMEIFGTTMGYPVTAYPHGAVVVTLGKCPCDKFVIEGFQQMEIIKSIDSIESEKPFKLLDKRGNQRLIKPLAFL